MLHNIIMHTINTKSVPCRSKVTITSDDIMECTVALSVLISDHLVTWW